MTNERKPQRKRRRGGITLSRNRRICVNGIAIEVESRAEIFVTGVDRESIRVENVKAPKLEFGNDPAQSAD